jgi:low temperature requirement protein LtrA
MQVRQARRKTAVLRQRTAGGAPVTPEELFFDLVYVFAVTQLSHHLLHHLTLLGALQTAVLWFAVWLGWQYTCWVTNWFDPQTPPIRLMLFSIMLLALVMAAALPEAFGARGLVFACAFAAIQVGRTIYVLFFLPRGTALRANFLRILVWVGLAGLLWIGGGLAAGPWRLALWIAAVLCEYVSPMIGFRLPLLGRSETSDWTIEGGHIVERDQLFVIVALGESILATGAGFADAERWSAPVAASLMVSFLGSLAMWWLYFGTSSKDAHAVITRSDDPGRIGAYFHYVHVILVGGIIVAAVGNDLVAADPLGSASGPALITLLAGPALYFIGSAIYKRIVYGMLPLSHLAGLAALAGIVPLAYAATLLQLEALTVAIMLGAGLWARLNAPRRPGARLADPG